MDDKLPWTRMRAVYRLLGLARRYGDASVDAACGKALDVDVISVTKIASMLERATEHAPAPPPRPAVAATARFARDPGEYATRRTSPTGRTNPTARPPEQHVQLRLITSTDTDTDVEDEEAGR